MSKRLAKCELEKKFLIAAEQKNYEVVRECLSIGVNPNARRTDRVTALHIAAERGDVELALLLLSAKGLNMNPFTIHGFSPLIVACLSRKDDMVEFLLNHGAAVDIPERFGKSSMHHAVFMDCLSIANILIKHHANLNDMDVFSHTPLSISVVDRHFLPMVKLLIENGADINLHRGDMVLPLFLEACLGCCSEKHLEVITYLLQSGIDPNTTDNLTNRNAFHYFAINNYLPLARELSNWGTDVYHIDRYNLTPLKLAKQHSNMDAVDFLDDLEYKRVASLESQNSKHFKVKFNDDLVPT
ncbi:hypothetical protein Trydic_g13923 [Trypoxylus dichotomus]